MKATTLKDRVRPLEGECTILIVVIREGLEATDEVVSIMRAGECPGLEYGGQGEGGEIEETWQP
jgi:hypothetical protein